jgi:hypothetical protein
LEHIEEAIHKRFATNDTFIPSTVMQQNDLKQFEEVKSGLRKNQTEIEMNQEQINHTKLGCLGRIAFFRKHFWYFCGRVG